jgi:hypothetical protein
MKLNSKIGTLMAVGAMAAAVPAAAHQGGGPNGHSHRGGNRPSGSHKCQPHNRAYVEGGTVDSATASTLAQNVDGTWSGTLVVDLTRASHAARADMGQTVTYTFDSAQLRVRLDDGATAFASGERVRLIGKLAGVGRKCPAPSSAPAPVFRRIVVHPASSSVSSGSDSSGSDSSSS